MIPRKMSFTIGGVVNLYQKPEDQQLLWVDDVSDGFKVGDMAKIETGYQYPLVDTHEVVTIEEIYPLGRIKVLRAEESRAFLIKHQLVSPMV